MSMAGLSEGCKEATTQAKWEAKEGHHSYERLAIALYALSSGINTEKQRDYWIIESMGQSTIPIGLLDPNSLLKFDKKTWTDEPDVERITIIRRTWKTIRSSVLIMIRQHPLWEEVTPTEEVKVEQALMSITEHYFRLELWRSCTHVRDFKDYFIHDVMDRTHELGQHGVDESRVKRSWQPAQKRLEAEAESGKKQMLQDKRTILLMLRRLANWNRIDVDLVREINKIIGPFNAKTEGKISNLPHLRPNCKGATLVGKMNEECPVVNSNDETPRDETEVDAPSSPFNEIESTVITSGPTTSASHEIQRTQMEHSFVIQGKKTQKSWIESGILNSTYGETPRVALELGTVNINQIPKIGRIWEVANLSEMNRGLKRNVAEEENWAETHFRANKFIKRDPFSAVQIGSFRL